MMKTQNSRVTKRLRLAGALIITGLAVQLASLFWNHPLSFIVFLSVGALVSMVGMFVYLFAILSIAESDPREGETTKTAEAR